MPQAKTATMLTVGQMIEAAFGNVNVNVINFRMLQTVLVLLARQLHILNRQVSLETEAPAHTYYEPETILCEKSSVSEFRIPPSSVASSYGASMPRIDESEPISESALRNQKYLQLLEKIEEHREKILRVINQRKNSRDTGVTSPSPMTSMTSTDIEFEKLLAGVIPEEKELTHEQLDELTHKLHNLQKGMDDGNFNEAELKPFDPENKKYIQEFRKGASLTDTLAVMKISERLDAAEKSIERLKILEPKNNNNTTTAVATLTETIADEMLPKSHVYVTKEDLQTSLEEKQAEILSKVNANIKQVGNYVEENTKQSRKLEIKLGDALKMKEKIEDLERSQISTAHQLSILDNGLTSQLTHLQEQLTHVQLDVESSLENMTESIANKGADAEMLTDLNRNFINLQNDIERTGGVQRDLTVIQQKLAFEIDRLKYETELLRDVKCDRDEVIDALRDKAGIKDLNGLVTNLQFESAYVYTQKQIEDAYGTFRKQEMVWQKALNDIYISIEEKVNKYHLDGLREDTMKHLNNLKSQLDCIKKILGEPLAASVTRKIYRDTKCLSCANPAHIMPPPGEEVLLPPLAPSTSSAEARKSKPNQYEKVLPACVTGLKIPHPIDSRAQLCTRYCGGSHTKKRRAPRTSTMRVEGKPLLKPDIGADGKIYQIEDEVVPCIPCNQEYGAGEGPHNGIDTGAEPIKSSHYSIGPKSVNRESLPEEFESGGFATIPRHSNTPSVPPMDQLSVIMTSAVSVQSYILDK